MRLLPGIKQIPTKLIIYTLSAMIIVHVVLLGFFTQQNRTTQYVAKRHGVIQQIMNITHMIEATPNQQVPQAVRAIQEPNIIAQLSDKPNFSLQATVLSFWRINNLVPKKSSSIRLSLKLADGHWLNLEAEILPDKVWTQISLLSIEILVGIIALFYLWSLNRFTKPLKEFQIAAQRLGVDMSPLALEEVKGPTVVRETAQAMNKMQKRIKDLLDDRTVLLAAISHDLRTPITRLKLRANLIEDKNLYDKTVSDLDEMDAMIAEILSYAKSDHFSERKIKLDICSLLQSICDDYIDMNHPVTFSGPNKRIALTGRPITLKRAFTNLIENAVKYGERADITLSVHGRRVTIEINDTGPGIADNELEKVFAPFYRCDHSRSREIAGTGLGLATTRDAILAHGGDIILKNRENSGLSVRVTLPISS